jgi:excisionase family DNA binding protein
MADRLTVAEAADALGITRDAVYKRIERDKIRHERDADGQLYVYVEKSGTSRRQDVQSESGALTSALEARIESLERQLEAERGSSAELRRLLAAALERIPPQLEAPERPPEATKTDAETEESPAPGQQEPWWRRWFGGWAKMRSDSGLRHNTSVVAVLVAALVGVYTVAVLLFAPDDLLGWVSTLVSTVASVWGALVIGLILFELQTQETDRKKKKELAQLLKTELSEVRRLIETYRTDVPDGAQTSHRMQYVLHYTHPLIVEEAARSGVFDTEQTSVMLTLARNMRQHNVLRQEAMMLRVEEVRARFASGNQYSEATEYFTRALRALQKSEGEIMNGCTKLLESLP